METSDVQAVLRHLRLEEKGQVWVDDWGKSQSSYHPDEVFFLKEEFVTQNVIRLGMTIEVRQAYLDSLPMFEDPALKRLAWHCHHLLFKETGYDRDNVGRWPMVPRELDPRADMFYAFVFLSGVPSLMKYYEDLYVLPEVAQSTLSDLDLWIREHKNRHGRYGLREINWLKFHFDGRVFRLGRLQFEMTSFRRDLRAYRNVQDSRVVLLAGEGLEFREDGQFQSADRGEAGDVTWTSSLVEDKKTVKGNPITPRGRALPKPIELALSDWKEVLRKGDGQLAVHIPATGPMTFEACGRSFDAALAFFRQHFPDFNWRVFTCESWLLDPQFEEILKPESNVVQFQKECYLYPLTSANDTQMWERVFGKRIVQMADAPRDSSMRRAIVEFIEQGGRLRSGGMALFPEDLNWGAQPYRKMKMPS
ncbi:DUF5596 domain-containing protein [bacterium]|nr:DUF5596 domain-containing protein [bacterium]